MRDHLGMQETLTQWQSDGLLISTVGDLALSLTDYTFPTAVHRNTNQNQNWGKFPSPDELETLRKKLFGLNSLVTVPGEGNTEVKIIDTTEFPSILVGYEGGLTGYRKAWNLEPAKSVEILNAIEHLIQSAPHKLVKGILENVGVRKGWIINLVTKPQAPIVRMDTKVTTTGLADAGLEIVDNNNGELVTQK